MEYIQEGMLRVAKPFHDFITTEAAPGTGVRPEHFWSAFAKIVREFALPNADLLARRDTLQAAIDRWHQDQGGQPHNPKSYKRFLLDIGYLLPEGADFRITTANVDPEIAHLAGPQLVVPITNARYAINAVNARWGSLYDALYGTDAISEDDGAQKGASYNPARGAKVMAHASVFLDRVAPLEHGVHAEVIRYMVRPNGANPNQRTLVCLMADGKTRMLAQPDRFAGFLGPLGQNMEPRAVVLRNNGLHVELRIDRDHHIGREHKAGVCDVVMEAAVTTILDFEDSVAVVDADDKSLAFRNLLGLLKGDLSASFFKGGEFFTRTLHPDHCRTAPDGTELVLPGRSLMLVRNVGLLMTTDIVLDEHGREIPEGILDTLVTALVCLHDLGPKADEAGRDRLRNSKTGSVYIVKPKQHGPEEVRFTCDLFTAVEQALKMSPKTLKIGIMDEERRTTLNLKECIRVARDRVIFINTGFLDRTGDEIHTCMEAGPMVRKNDMRAEPWMIAYEDWNVDVGLAAGFSNKAQIGKGMWAKPDRMEEMIRTKISHPRSGANCAWVPSPTAAVLHAMHYHQVDVFAHQRELVGQSRASLDDLLRLPLLGAKRPTLKEIEEELANNAQSILGYVVRWVNQGVGCSKVPDISDVGLMEDRATLRISSQHMANWLRHGICSENQIMAALRRMAEVVDRQNVYDPAYRPMGPDYDQSIAFQAARDLIFLGREQPNGYTEPILHARRRTVKTKR